MSQEYDVDSGDSLENDDEPISLIMSEYSSPTLTGVTILLSFSLLMLGVAPGMFDLVSDTVAIASGAVGFVLAGVVLVAGLSGFVLYRGVHVGQGSVLGITTFRHRESWTGYSALGDANDIVAVYINPGIDLLSKAQQWKYPVALLMNDGRSVTVANESQTVDLEGYSVPTAMEYAQALGCELHIPEEETYVKVVKRNGAFSFEPTTRDIGLIGPLVVIAAASGLVWVLWKLASTI